jgi:hypothetical protein
MQKRPKCVSCQETNLFLGWHIYEHKQEDIELKGTVVQSYYGSTNKSAQNPIFDYQKIKNNAL